MYTAEQIEYLVEVLGVRSLVRPDGMDFAAQPVTESPRPASVLVVIAPGSTEGQLNLVRKMMASIHWTDYEIQKSSSPVSDPNRLAVFHFLGATAVSSGNVWSFCALDDLTEGTPEAIKTHKMIVWNELKKFRDRAGNTELQ